MGFKTFGNRVMVKVDENTQTQSGLFIPQNAAMPFKWGTVISPGTKYATPAGWVGPNFSAGDKVFIDSLGGASVQVEGGDYVIVRNEDIVGFTAPADEPAA